MGKKKRPQKGSKDKELIIRLIASIISLVTALLTLINRLLDSMK